jgi:Tfp pilus assembly protein PilN
MRAVNLIPGEARRGGTGDLRSLRGPGSAVVGLLGVVLLLVTLYVLASNSVSERQAQLTGLQNQLAQTQAEAAKLTGYTQFAQLAEARIQTVKEIASGRFDWQQALSDLSRVVPANTTLSSLSATVGPGVGSAGAATGSLRGDITVPAFELQGCTASQDDVARLMSRLRLIRGVSRVTLSNSVRAVSATPATPVSSSASSPTGGCAANAPTFDLVVFFQALPTVSATPAGSTGPTGAVGPAAPTGTTSPTSSGSAQ